MLRDNSEEKLKNAIIYFVKNTNHCNKTKLFKLLYYFDFLHCQEIGRPVTGLKYNAWPKGPVPVSLNNEIEVASDLFNGSIKIEFDEFKPGMKRVDFIVNDKFNEVVYSRRELRILKKVAEVFTDTTSEKMIDVTHFENHPWDIVYNKMGNRQGEIPFELAFKDSEKDKMEEIYNEEIEIWSNYK
jgi:uncharacterized phage-associated protein